MSTFITVALFYIAIGSVLWIINDPFKAIDVTLRTYVKRNGRLPPPSVHVAATGLIILAWPMVAWAMLKGLREGYRARRDVRHG